MKGNIIYSLTDRGLFSELTNLALAKVYADYYDKNIIINTRNWNARISKGWSDYFENTLRSKSDFYTAQLRIYTTEKIWIGKIYYETKYFFKFYFYYYSNIIYCKFHKNTELTKDVFFKMRSTEFIDGVLKDDCFTLVSSAFKNLYIYNAKTSKYINDAKLKLNLPLNYIGVHIRRGDKIVSKEMEQIGLSEYINEIIKYKNKSNNVFIATDDISIIKDLERNLSFYGINVYYNKNNKQKGFDEKAFNLKNKETKYAETLNMMLDLDILIHSCFFIGTYTSNVSRVIPFYIGLDKCRSLDSDWNLLYF